MRDRLGAVVKSFNGVSIVIASKGRVKFLEELLESVQIARSNFTGVSEVILVDDSNENDILEIDRLCKKYSARRIYHSPSVAEKRNVGVRESKYDIILFLDSDCIASPNLLNEHMKLYSTEQVGGVAGLLEFVGEDTWFWNAVNKSPFVICFGLPKMLNEVPWTPTANLSVRKDVFDLVGGFDRSFPDKPGGEDVDLGLRITKNGFVFKCTKDGLVYHSKKTWVPVGDMVKRLWHYGSANYYLMDKHPDWTVGTLPKKPVIAFVILLFTIAMMFINPLFTMLFPIWLLSDNLLTAVMFNRFSNFNNSTLMQQFIVQWLIFHNDMGFIWRCIVKQRFSYIFKDVVYYERQMEGILYNGAISTWSNLIALMILFGAGFLLL